LEYDIAAVLHTPLAANQFWMEHEFSKFGMIQDEQLEVSFDCAESFVNE